jgi:hypothetical protein
MPDVGLPAGELRDGVSANSEPKQGNRPQLHNAHPFGAQAGLSDQDKKSGAIPLPNPARRIWPAAAASMDFFGRSAAIFASDGGDGARTINRFRPS